MRRVDAPGTLGRVDNPEVSASTPGPERKAVQARVTWPVDSAANAQVVNHIAVADGARLGSENPEGSIYIIFGHVAPPMLATAEDVEQFFREQPELRVEVRATVFMTVARAAELHQMLGERLATHRGAP